MKIKLFDPPDPYKDYPWLKDVKTKSKPGAEVKHCKACNTVLKKGVKFCFMCGTPVGAKPQMIVIKPGHEEPEEKKPPQPVKKKVDHDSIGKLIRIVIVLLIGYFIVTALLNSDKSVQDNSGIIYDNPR